MKLTQFTVHAMANNVLVKLNVYYSSITNYHTPMLLDSFSLGNKKQTSLDNCDTDSCIARDSLAEAMCMIQCDES